MGTGGPRPVRCRRDPERTGRVEAPTGPEPGREAAWRVQTDAPPAQIGGSRLSPPGSSGRAGGGRPSTPSLRPGEISARLRGGRSAIGAVASNVTGAEDDAPSFHPNTLEAGMAAPVGLRRGGRCPARRRLGAVRLLLRPLSGAGRPRGAGVLVRAAARLRRRPHRGDRQHDAEAAPAGQAPTRASASSSRSATRRSSSRSPRASRVAARTVKSHIPAFQSYGGYVGAGVSGTFLWIIGVLNLIVLLDIVRVYARAEARRLRRGAARAAAARPRLHEPVLPRPLLAS